MAVVTIHAAKSSLSKLIARAEAGEEIVLARGTEPVARLVAVHKPQVGRRFGSLKGVVTVGKAFFDPLPDEELSAWE
jgi:antitoxin (DNA-binding transcriptional repressor) of toxin-antitoxin stability system